MKRFKPWFIATVAAALALAAATIASAQPLPPSGFWGTVTSPDGPVAAGLAVEAHVGDTLCGTSETYLDDSGVTRYLVHVQNRSTTAGCGGDGDAVSFRVGGRAATQTSAHGLRALETVNLTLAPDVTSVTIQVAVWRRNVDPVGALAISTRPPGGAWSRIEADDWPLDMSIRSSSGRWNRSEVTPVEVTLQDGSTVTIDVAVWRRNVDPVGALAISTRPPGGAWSRIEADDWPLDMSIRSSSGRWNRSEVIEVEVELE